ncbi:MAG: IS4 family transposase [Bryobacterales bacterium]|nr:IS4 family transposase [Bryobacterales bacterium]MCZ2153074.1 IS4 family transposase [Bryobacterales bacterium]
MNRVSSIFSQMLKQVPRNLFDRAVQQHYGERHSRGFRSWDQFVAMLFCQLGQAKSLREIEEGMRASEGKLRHLGIEKAPAHSTLAYANQQRPWQVYETLFALLRESLTAKLSPGQRAPRLNLPAKLLSLDSTVIDLCAKVFDWAKYRKAKGAVKLHLLLDHEGLLPHYAVITEGKRSDIAVARNLDLPAGSLLVMDRGYCDYAWFARLTRQEVHFVTRLKDKASYVVVEERAAEGDSVLADEIIVFAQHATEDNENFFRLVRYRDPKTRREFTFLTNHLELPAATIAAIYKERWQVELFFKALKQNLRIKSFVGTSANALKTQIWTALIALLLVRYLQLRSKLAWHLSRFIALLRQQLFVYRDLWRFLDHPFEGPPGANVEEEIPPPLLAALYEVVVDPQPQPETEPTGELSPMMATPAGGACG